MFTIQRFCSHSGRGVGIIRPSDAAVIGGATIVIRSPCHRRQQAERHHKRQQQRNDPFLHHLFLLVIFSVYEKAMRPGFLRKVGGAAFPLPPLWKADSLRSDCLGLTRVTQQDTSCSAASAAFSTSRWRAAASRASFFSCSSRFFSFSRDCCAAWLAAALARFAFFLRSDSS